MILVVQRVSHCQVEVDGQTVAAINNGAMVLMCVEKGDNAAHTMPTMAKKLVQLRLFEDEAGRMNRALLGSPDLGLCLVPQFTLAADCRKGTRPSFHRAAPPEQAEEQFHEFCHVCEQQLERPVSRGAFGAMMNVNLCNTGPATFILKSH